MTSQQESDEMTRLRAELEAAREQGEVWRQQCLVLADRCSDQAEALGRRAERRRHEVWTLCGSTRFRKEYDDANFKLTLEGKVVISCGVFAHAEGLALKEEEKKLLDEVHLQKIDMADAILVINGKTTVCDECRKSCTACIDPEANGGSSDPVSDCCGAPARRRPYHGESTEREIQYAHDRGKKVFLLHEV